MRGRLTLGLAALRLIGLTALVLLLLDPTWTMPEGAGGAAPLTLLDASLSMRAPEGPWAAALDSARRLAGPTGTIWRFGDAVTAFDTTLPAAGATRLAPALAAAAARGGPVTVITDGAIGDTADLAPDLRRRPRIIVLPRAQPFDGFVAAVDGPRRVAQGDTVRLRVAYGTAGRREGGGGKNGTLVVLLDGRRLTSRRVSLPDSGTLVTALSLPPSLLPHPGSQALEVRLETPADGEPRDDARWFVVDVSPEPTVVVLGAPPDWESRFFARTIGAVARVPVKLYDLTEPGRWRDGTTLDPVTTDAVARAASGARLLALIGDPAQLARFRRRGRVVQWPQTAGRTGEWYVDPPPPSPLAAALGGLAWDSLPPLAGLAQPRADSGGTALLTARLGRRGAAQPVIVLHDSAGIRRVTVLGTGLWRWGFRGGAPGETYRTLVATLADWLLGTQARAGVERFGPAQPEIPNGLPVVWRWTAAGPAGPAGPVIVGLEPAGARSAATDTLVFDASGRAELRVPPGRYRWRAQAGPEHGLFVVEQYSDEWRPAPATVSDQAGETPLARRETGPRDQWWWYVLVVAAFAAEWAWRRRQGLP
jgi:hypothetical protein